MGDFSENLFSSLRLPTSMYCSKRRYITNHNQVNVRTLLMTSRHFMMISIYFFLLAASSGAHTAALKLDPTFSFFARLPGDESEARQALLICTLLTPILNFLSLLVTWKYLGGCQFKSNCQFRC